MEDSRCMLQIRIDPNLKAAAQAAAEEKGQTLSTYVKSLILKDLLKHKE